MKKQSLTLTIKCAAQCKKRMQIDGRSLTIGRAEDNMLSFDDPDVSGYHAEIVQNKDTYLIIDNDSSNGTWLNGRRVSREKLSHGDVISICRNEIRVELAPTGATKGAARSGNQPQKVSLNLHELMNHAAVHVKKGRWDEALEVVHQVLKADPNHQGALTILNQIEEKKRIYARVASLVLPGSRKNTKAIIGEDDFVQLEAPPFAIRFHLSKDDRLIKEIYKTLKRAYDRVGKHLDCFPASIKVEVYASPEELQDAAGKNDRTVPAWAAGICDDVIRINTADDTLVEPQFLYIMLSHEYAHYAVRELTDGTCPCWLDEGIAQCEAQNLPKSADRLLQRALKNDSFIPLALLEGDFSLLSYPELVDLAYVEVYSIMEFLLAHFTWQDIRGVLTRIKNAEAAEQGLEILELNYTTLESKWKEWLKTQDGYNHVRNSFSHSSNR